VRIGEHFLAVDLAVKIALVIAADQRQMAMGQRLSILPAKNADGDGLVVNHRKGFIRAADCSGQQCHSGGKIECKRSDHKLRLNEPIGSTNPP
jgi:hypothetical protein